MITKKFNSSREKFINVERLSSGNNFPRRLAATGKYNPQHTSTPKKLNSTEYKLPSQNELHKNIVAEQPNNKLKRVRKVVNLDNTEKIKPPAIMQTMNAEKINPYGIASELISEFAK